MNALQRAAEIAMVKKLAEDVQFGKPNYMANLESLIVRARLLFDERSATHGRGQKHGNLCHTCDGVYVKEARCGR